MASYDGVTTLTGQVLLDRFAPITTQSLGEANDAEWEVRSALAREIRNIEVEAVSGHVVKSMLGTAATFSLGPEGTISVERHMTSSATTLDDFS